MKRIALLGGSFNPPHPGHFEMARLVHRAVRADEVWLLFSVNTDKNPADYAPLADRIAMAELLRGEYRDVPVVLSTFQEELGVHITADVLKAVQDAHPDVEFLWVMGTDNLISFHTWEEYDRILRDFPCLVLRRQPYVEEALDSVTVRNFPELERDTVDDLLRTGNGWHVLPNTPFDMSSSGFLKALREGQRDFPGLLSVIADYIRAHRLYGVD